MKNASCLLSIASVLVSYPLSFASSYLLLTHVGATDVMWLLFWINWPISLTLSLSLAIAGQLTKKDKE